jgi:hypothetical protein
VKEIVFFGLFALVILGVIVTLIQNRARRKYWEEREAELRAEAVAERIPVPPPHASRAVEAPAPSPDAPAPSPDVPAEAAAPKLPAFDPMATRIYDRPADSMAPTDRLERVKAKLPVGARPRLICVGGRQKGHVFEIPPRGLTVGRADDNDVIIHDGRVSSHHAWLGVLHGKAVLKDYQSLNGTFLNADMNAPIGEAVLVDGDTIFFGGHGAEQYRFVVE